MLRLALKQKHKQLALGLIFLFLSLFYLNLTRGASYQPSWLHVGVSATYDFGSNATKVGFPIIYFNDSQATGDGISGNCSWTVTAVQNGLATVRYEINVVIPGCNTSEEYDAEQKAGRNPALVLYTGKEFVDSAENGDFSFVTTLPADQVNISRGFIVNNNPPGTYLVGFWGGFSIDRVFNITLNLQDLTMVDQNGVPWGKWLYWINPLFYPVHQSVQETAFYDWAGTQVQRNVTYVLPGTQPAMDYWVTQTAVGNFSNYYLATTLAGQNQSSITTAMGSLSLSEALSYEPRTGLLLNSPFPDYCDDILSQKMGILELAPQGYFWLAQLEGISFVPQEAASQPNYTPYLAVAGVAVAAVLAYLGYRRRSKR